MKDLTANRELHFTHCLPLHEHHCMFFAFCAGSLSTELVRCRDGKYHAYGV